MYNSLLPLIEEVIEILFEDSDEPKRKSSEDKISDKTPERENAKKVSAFAKITNKIKIGLKKQKRISQRFFIETSFSTEVQEISKLEIILILKAHLIQLHQIHDICLFLLRGEIRMRIYSFLSNIKNQNYWDGEEHTDSEWFIGHLSRELLVVQLAIKSVLPPNKLNFVWEHALDIIIEMLIIGIGEIKDLSMSKLGLAMYIKNVKLLQAELLQIEIVWFM